MSDRDRAINELAYRIWEDAGRPEGQGDHHWHEAKRRYDAEHSGGTKKAAPVGERADATTEKAEAKTAKAKKAAAKTPDLHPAAKVAQMMKAGKAKASFDASVLPKAPEAPKPKAKAKKRAAETPDPKTARSKKA